MKNAIKSVSFTYFLWLPVCGVLDSSPNAELKADMSHDLFLPMQCTSTSSVVVEEDTRYIEFEVRRTFGTFGEISVTIATTEGTAVAPAGESAVT